MNSGKGIAVRSNPSLGFPASKASAEEFEYGKGLKLLAGPPMLILSWDSARVTAPTAISASFTALLQQKAIHHDPPESTTFGNTRVQSNNRASRRPNGVPRSSKLAAGFARAPIPGLRE